jgi:hypothetical protein
MATIMEINGKSVDVGVFRNILKVCMNNFTEHAITSSFGLYSRIDWVMGNGFFKRVWDGGRITETEKRKLGLLTGPNGKAILKILMARKMKKAPWTDDEIKNLNVWQAKGFFHPFTCPNDSDQILVATKDGWVCEKCNYTQDWAHGFMTEENKEYE